jgi:hypothetical protein
MQTGKSIFSVIISCFLLLVFVAKLTHTVFNPIKFQKVNIVLSTDGSEEQDDQMKKQDNKYSNDFEMALNKLSDFAGSFCYLTICNLHHAYLVGFVDAHYPTVLAPPPDNNSFSA